MNVISEFFGLSIESTDSQLRGLRDDLARCYNQIAKLQATIRTYESRTPISEASVQDFVFKMCHKLYPGLKINVASYSPPVTMLFETNYTSFFYSDKYGNFLYADSPMHSFGLNLTRQGITAVKNFQKEHLTQLTEYLDVDTENTFIYNTFGNKGGHPHCLNSDTEQEVTSAWCFGNNSGVDELLETACDISTVGVLFRKLYLWLTEINVDSMYHSNVFPLALQPSSHVVDDAAVFGNEMYSKYKSCFTEAIQYFRANKDYQAWNVGMLTPLVEAVQDYYDNLTGNSFFKSFLHNEIVSFSQIPEDKLTQALCLYQFVTACILLQHAYNLKPVIRSAIEADLFYIPYVWTQVCYRRFGQVGNDGTLNYRDAFLHYFDGFDYTLRGE